MKISIHNDWLLGRNEDMNQTTPTISDDLHLRRWANRIRDAYTLTEAESLLKDFARYFAEHITPEKVSEETKDYSDSHQFAGAIAHNCVVEEITKRTKEYLNE